jgi:hypothetical protein
MNGTISKKVGNISINCISKDAKDLLDDLCKGFRENQDKDVNAVSGYQALYWACRYSGLIRRNGGKKR